MYLQILLAERPISHTAPVRSNGEGWLRPAERLLFFWVGLCGIKGQLIVGFILKISL